MLSIAQKITLIKKVNSHILSSERIKALSEVRSQFDIADITEISDMVYLKESTVRMILS